MTADQVAGAEALLPRRLDGGLRRRAFDAILAVGVLLWLVNLQPHP
jgi:hypothetical protein